MKRQELTKETVLKFFDHYIKYLELKDNKFLIGNQKENLLFLPEKSLTEILLNIREKGLRNFNVLEVISSNDIRELLKEFIKEKKDNFDDIQIGLAFPAFPTEEKFYYAGGIYKLDFNNDLTHIELAEFYPNKDLTKLKEFDKLRYQENLLNSHKEIYNWTHDLLDIVINIGSNFIPPPYGIAINLYTCKDNIKRLLRHFRKKNTYDLSLKENRNIPEESIGFIFTYFDIDYTKNIKKDLQDYKNKIDNQLIKKIKKLWYFENNSSDVNHLENFTILNFELTDSQKRQYARIHSLDLCLIEGPPGTGKSEFIVTFCADKLIRKESAIVTSTNNKPIDSVLRKFENFDKEIQAQNLLKTGKFLQRYQRLGNKQYLENFKDSLFNFVEEIESQDIELAKKYLKELQEEINLLEEIIRLFYKIETISDNIRKIENEHFSKSLPEDPLFTDKSAEDAFDKNSFDTFCYLFHKLQRWYNFIPIISNRKKRNFLKLINTYQLVFPLAKDFEFLSCQSIYKRGQPFVERLKRFVEKKEEIQRLNKERELLQIQLNDCLSRCSFQTDKFILEAKRLYFIRKREYLYWELVCDKNFIRKIKEKKEEIKHNKFWGIQEIFKFSPIILTTALSARNICPPNIDMIDFIIVDEASQTLFCYILPLYLRGKKFIAIGDKNQLQPVLNRETQDFDCEDIPYHLSVKKSVFEILEELDKTEDKKRRLLEHFRCQESIIEFCDELIGYGLQIKTPEEKYNFSNKLPKKLKPFFEQNLTFVNIDGEAKGDLSKYNESEINFICYFINELLSIGTTPEDIAVISFYRAQIDRIKIRLKKILYPLKKDLLIGTVHSLQGDEREIVLLSCVCSKSEQFQKSPLFKDKKAMNVAVSRAKKHLIVVGNRGAILQLHSEIPIKKLYEHILKKGTVIDYPLEAHIMKNCANYFDNYKRPFQN